MAGIKESSGSFADLGPGSIAVVDDTTRSPRPAIGQTAVVRNSAGANTSLKVVALIKQSIDTANVGSVVSSDVFDSIVGKTAPTVAFIDLETGPQSSTTDAIKARTALRPDIELTEGNTLGRLIGSVFDFLINAVNGLLMMSVIVALIGIINTLSLSILERRRELGLLRAVGMTDRRVERMVRLESLLIASLGTVVGVLLGLFVGWALVRSISNVSETGISFSFPAGRLILVLVLGILMGFLAALIPARRSTRLDVLEAIQAT